jgi:hypothetical protein
MSIILGMAGDAAGINGGKDIIKVALRACQADVGTGQGEIRS